MEHLNINKNIFNIVADNNYYVKPIDDDYVIYTYQPSEGYDYRTLADWQFFSGQDLNSKTSPKNVTNVNDIIFEYNPTKINKVVTLSVGSYIDVKNVSYSGSVTLKPYTSIVLIGV